MSKFFTLIVFGLILSSCASYKQNIMLKTSNGVKPEAWQKAALGVEKNYIIQKNDILKLDVYTNNGEKLIDPNPELSNTSVNQNQQRIQPEFLVDQQGIAKFPLVGEIKLEGLSLRQAEEILQKQFETYFKGSFVQLKFANKRVVVLGATGGHVIPLPNQQTTLAEVLAQAKGLPNDSKANAIRVVRGDKVYAVDLSTIDGFLAGNMIIEPNDIVYVEPVRRPFTEGLKDNTGLLSVLVSLATLAVVIINLTK